MKKEKPKVISLFSGCGGLDLGFEKAGFQTTVANEFWAPAAKTFKLNFPKTDLIIGDICKIEEKVWDKYTGQIDVIFGGPPCQGFSQSGKQWIGDQRNYLFEKFMKVVEIVKPNYVLIENVPQILTLGNGKFKAEILSYLENIGYQGEARILNSSHYGVPQARNRAFIIANRKDLIRVPFPGKKGHLWSARQAIGDLEDTEIAETFDRKIPYKNQPQNTYQEIMRENSNEISSHLLPRIPDIDKLRIGNITPGSSEKNLPDHLKQKSRLINPKLKNISVLYRRLNPNRPCPTLTKGVPQQPWHYKYNRRLTIRELARLQSFPDDFIFPPGTYNDTAGQIGNSVPPLLAQTLAEEFYKVISKQ